MSKLTMSFGNTVLSTQVQFYSSEAVGENGPKKNKSSFFVSVVIETHGNVLQARSIEPFHHASPSIEWWTW